MAKPVETSEMPAIALAWARGEAFAPSAGTRLEATTLRALLTGSNPGWPLAPGPVRMEGVTVTGTLDLHGVTRRADGFAMPQFEAADCMFEAPIVLDFAVINGLWLERCNLNGLQLRNARIAGQLRLSGSQARSGPCAAGEKPYAVLADGAVIGGDVLLDFDQEPFSASGTVSLAIAQIAGQLSAKGADLDGTGGRALDCGGARIGGGVFLNAAGGSRFKSQGGLGFIGAELASTLDVRVAGFSADDRTEPYSAARSGREGSSARSTLADAASRSASPS